MLKNLVLVSSVLFSNVIAWAQPADTTLIAFSSDTQAPMWVESLWLKKTNNRLATQHLFRDISYRKPGSLFILGDVVNLGTSNRQWKPIDREIESLRHAGVDVHAVLGNHEVMGRKNRGARKFQTRFPDHVATGYVQVKDSVAVVLLNSNFKKMSRADDRFQEDWYRYTLAELDADPAIQFIITGCHHSPYTNSKIVKPSTAVQEKFLPAFMSSPKSRLFVSGHCHGFEHYQVQGKDFLVIGGGGGLHQPLRSGEDTLPDLAADYKPLFHYITVQRQRHELQVTSYRITPDFTGFEPALTLQIDAAKQVPVAASAQ